MSKSKLEIYEEVLFPSGVLRLSAIVDGQLFEHHYSGYTKAQAKKMFRYRIKSHLEKTKTYK